MTNLPARLLPARLLAAAAFAAWHAYAATNKACLALTTRRTR